MGGGLCDYRVSSLAYAKSLRMIWYIMQSVLVTRAFLMAFLGKGSKKWIYPYLGGSVGSGLGHYP